MSWLKKGSGQNIGVGPVFLRGVESRRLWTQAVFLHVTNTGRRFCCVFPPCDVEEGRGEFSGNSPAHTFSSNVQLQV